MRAPTRSRTSGTIRSGGELRRLRRRVAAVLTMVAFASIVGATTANAVTSGGWSSLGTGGGPTTPALNGRVNVVTSVGPNVYVGGLFLNAGGLPGGDDIAMWNGSHWSSFGAGLNNAVYAIAVSGGTVFAGGSFSNAGGDPQADSLAMWDGSHWTSVGGVSLDGPVFALQVVGSDLFVGGGFDNADNIAAADGIVEYDIVGQGFSAIGSVSTVSSMAVSTDGGLYVGSGGIDMNGIANADFLARFDLTSHTWSAVGAPGPSISAIQNRVRGVATSGTDVYVVGDFVNADGIGAADKIAKWNGVAWSAVGNDGAGGGYFGEGATSLYTVIVDHGNVFAGGNFLNAGGNALVDVIAGFRGGHWTNVGTNATGTNGPGSGTVFSLAVNHSKLYVGTLDTAFGGSAMNCGSASFKLRQPDARIAVGQGPAAGNNVYNVTAAHQGKGTKTDRGKTATFAIPVQNDGFETDTIALKGPGSRTGFMVHYLAGAHDVTGDVVAGTFTFANVAAGATRSLTLKVAVGAHTAVGASGSWLVTASSQGIVPAVKDAVKATVTAT
ncbi:MAG TPA: hypothetical protein VID47_10480 [Actinomycetota bacterium]